jgi:UDP-galactopyranose mutase
MKKALVVGAGFAGAVVARTLADTGEWQVLVIDKRPHFGGNAYDHVDMHGIRVHDYGPHLWHTSNDEVQEWASQFTEWVEYKHEVRAQLANGDTVPLPINPETIEKVFGTRFFGWCSATDWMSTEFPHATPKKGAHAAFLETLVEHHAEVTNARQHVENSVGKELCDLFFEPYTKKMWGLSLEELPASVAARIPTNVESGSTLYFPKDKHQVLPKDGYEAMFLNIFNHENIAYITGLSREELSSFNHEDPTLIAEFERLFGAFPLSEANFDHVFTAEPIDAYYGSDLGALPWRSIRMHTASFPLPSALPSAVLNFTHDGPFTRATEWKKLPGHGENSVWTTLTFEEPCDYTENYMERYYPVKTSQRDCPNRALYNQYADRAAQNPKLTFIGRCGTYQYLDMWMVISQTLKTVKTFLEKQDAEV